MSRKRTRKSLSAYTLQNKVRLVHGGQEYFSELGRMIDKAQTTIHLQTYIFQEDETGRLVADALIRAAKRGVSVFLLLDGYASQDLSKKFIKTLKDAGVHFRWFSPLLKSRGFYFGRRMHHKVLVTDASCCLAGGVNISNRYNDINGNKAWLDWALYVEGQAALKLHIICTDMWEKAYWKKVVRRSHVSRLPGIIPAEECLVRVRRNDWVQGKNQISHSYLEMFRDATSRITIVSSYFLPGKLLRNKMAQAAKRGVNIRVILAGVSDVKVARLAEQYMYRWLFRNNIEIYEYQDTILHGKLATYDGIWVTTGSFNVNNISAYASIELNMDTKNEAFASSIDRELQDIIQKHCIRETPEIFFKQTSLFKRILQGAAYRTIRILFFLFTFYFKREK